MPANTKPSGSVAGGRSIAGPTSSVPIGAKKTVGGAKKAVGGVAGGATKAVGGVTSSTTRGVNGVVGNASKGVNNTLGGVTKTTGGIVGGATKSTQSTVNNATRGVDHITGGASKPLSGVVNKATKGVGGIMNGSAGNTQKPAPQGLPKPYDSHTAASSYNPQYPTTKKTAVKPGMSKPFTPPAPKEDDKPKPYPGTNTLPGQGGTKPVQRRYTPAPRLGPQVKEGQKMMHIGAF